MSEDTIPQGTEAEAAQRIAALEATESSEASAQPEEEETQQPVESEEVMPASEEQELPTNEEQSEDEDQRDDVLPEDSSERTRKAFEKLTENNRQLKEKLKERSQDTKTGESVYDDLFGPQSPDPVQVPQGYEQVTNAQNYQNLDQQQVNSIASQFVYEDPQTGERTVDVERLVGTLQQANQQAVYQAEQRANDRIERFEQTRQVDEAHTKHPYLDPKNEQFDPVFYDIVRLKVLDNKVRGGQRTLNQLAEDALEQYKPRLTADKAKQQALEQYKQSQKIRKQAQPAARGRGADRTGSAAQQEALRQRTQSSNIHESDKAIIDRLKRAS